MNRSPAAARLAVEPLEPRTTPATFPPGFQLVPIVTMADDLEFVSALSYAPDGRIFAAEKDGDLRVVENGRLLPEPALSLEVDTVAERGLLGVAFDPQFETNQFIYLFYSSKDTGDGVASVISRFTINGNRIDPTTERVLLRIPTPAVAHVAGMIQFGPDGRLYITVGDNGFQEDSQKLNSFYGKLLRINPNGSIPTDNPFYNTAEGPYRAIWALGFRNPFTFNFQPGTGRLFVNDVGQNAWEEINDVVPGGNYGWPRKEGPDGVDDPAFIDPVFYYGHPPTQEDTIEGLGIAIVNGAFYNPKVASFPSEFVGKYIYADMNAGWIRVFDPATGQSAPFAQGIGTRQNTSAITGMLVDPDGNIIFSLHSRGLPHTIHKVIYVPPATPPVITAQPRNQTTDLGQPATFEVAATGTDPIRYQWQRDGQDIPGATGPTYTLPNPGAADDGAAFRVVVANELGAVTSSVATLRVLANTAPTAVITAPASTDTFGLGRSYTLRGIGTDPEQGTLPPSAYKWEVFFVTGSVDRPYHTQTGGTEGTFVLPNTSPYDEIDVQLRFVLTVTDDRGSRSSTSVTLSPEVARITIDTNIPGLAATTLGGQPFAGSTDGVVGFVRAVGALPAVTLDGARYRFVGWSDGGERLHDVDTPPEGFTIRATYRRVDPLVIGNGPGARPVLRVEQVDTGETTTVQVFEPEFKGGVRVATGDVNGDGIPDIVAAAGSGGGPRVRVFDGRTLDEMANFFAFEESFTGGVFVAAADVNGDGTDDLVLSPDIGGGGRVLVLSGADPGSVLTDFLGIEDPDYRGGVHAALGDLNGDGVPDLAVGAAADGPRVAVFDGARLLWARSEPAPPRLVADFFAFEDTLRGGVSPAVGDVNGDGTADLVVGPGRGGSPRVIAIDGRGLVNGGDTTGVLANLYVGDETSRGGVRLAIKDIDGDDDVGLITSGNDTTAPINVYQWNREQSGFGDSPARVLDGFEDGGAGVFVG
jgi:glucose/arabinose dehydrogenase